MYYSNVEEINIGFCRGEISADITIGWLADEWGYKVWIYEESTCIYEYSAGNSSYDSKWVVKLDRALEPSRLRRYAQNTAEEMAEELGLKSDCVFEEEE